MAVGIGSRDLRRTSLYLLHTVEVYRRAVHALVVEHAVGAVGQLALLPVYQRRHAPYLVAACHAHVAVVAIGHVAARGTAPLVEHYVEHATRAFRVVFRPGVGHDLNALHHRGGHGLEYLRGVAGVHGVELAVHIDLELDDPFTLMLSCPSTVTLGTFLSMSSTVEAFASASSATL